MILISDKIEGNFEKKEWKNELIARLINADPKNFWKREIYVKQ